MTRHDLPPYCIGLFNDNLSKGRVSLKLWVSFAKEPYKRDYFLQKGAPEKRLLSAKGR